MGLVRDGARGRRGGRDPGSVRLGSARCREEKEFGFRGTEGQFLLLRDCDARVLVSEKGSVSGDTSLGGSPGLALGEVTALDTCPEPLSSLQSSTSR